MGIRGLNWNLNISEKYEKCAGVELMFIIKLYFALNFLQTNFEKQIRLLLLLSLFWKTRKKRRNPQKKLEHFGHSCSKICKHFFSSLFHLFHALLIRDGDDHKNGQYSMYLIKVKARDGLCLSRSGELLNVRGIFRKFFLCCLV